jgi:hypothetical protein
MKNIKQFQEFKLWNPKGEIKVQKIQKILKNIKNYDNKRI